MKSTIKLIHIAILSLTTAAYADESDCNNADDPYILHCAYVNATGSDNEGNWAEVVRKFPQGHIATITGCMPYDDYNSVSQGAPEGGYTDTYYVCSDKTCKEKQEIGVDQYTIDGTTKTPNYEVKMAGVYPTVSCPPPSIHSPLISTVLKNG